jgi:hypothetical protein
VHVDRIVGVRAALVSVALWHGDDLIGGKWSWLPPLWKKSPAHSGRAGGLAGLKIFDLGMAPNQNV